MNMSDWRVLVVEDEEDSMELVQGLLEHHGVQNIGASSGEQALQLLQTENPTMLIIDLSLPGIDGWTLLERVKKQSAFAGVPRVAITAYHTAEVANKAIEAGFDAYFPKPLDATTFVRELRGLIAD